MDKGITRALARLRAWQVARRRERNLRTGTRRAARGGGPRLPAAGVLWLLLAVCGGAVIASHASHLAASAGAPPGAPLQGARYQAAAFQHLLPGLEFDVRPTAGIDLHEHRDGALLVASNMDGAAPQRMDLCQYLSGQRIAPVRIGYRFGQLRAGGEAVAARAVALAGAASADVPAVRVSGNAGPAPLIVHWEGAARWIGDAGGGRPLAAGPGALGREGWLVWETGALRISRRASARCAAAGELVVQLLRPAQGARRALAAAFAADGRSASAWLAPGRYAVPREPLPGLEDETLFRQLQSHGLVRIGANGLVELAPRDLAAWRAAGGEARAADLAPWRDVVLDAESARLMRRLYHLADGEFVRRQVAVFNDERRLLAWRVRPASLDGDWQASVAGMAAATSGAMPAAASALFAELPQAWSPWTRLAGWPASGERTARLVLRLAQPARGGETVRMMVVGRVLHAEGATLRRRAAACTGRACPARDAVQAVELEMDPGARALTVTAEPLALAALADSANAAYRHIALEDGRLAWRRLAQPLPRAASRAAADATIVDRHGALLWNAGRPTPAALEAGMGALLGYRVGQPNSVSGMLARIEGGGRHTARLSVDLALQSAAQSALDCIGMRGGQWLGGACSGAGPAPAGRRAGIVVLDTETGDVLAAAGAGGARVTDANWAEARDFDRSNPARSPFRLPALQHDGGVHQSPGSTFKVISALGLEAAARSDAQLDALLGGMALERIDQLAQRRGFAFRTAQASYPYDAQRARITNYREDRLGRRASEGRFGLAEALTYSVNTWFAWAGELSDRSLFGRAEGGTPALQPLEDAALDEVRPIVAMARRVGFGQEIRLDGGLLPAAYDWERWDVLQPTPGRIDPIDTRHELRQMTIGLRMQATPLQMALASAAVGQGRFVAPRMLLSLDGEEARERAGDPVPVRLDRIRAGMKGVVDSGTASGAFRGAALEQVRRGLHGKTGTAPTVAVGTNGTRTPVSTVWFTGYLEPGSLPGQQRRLAFAAFVSHSDATGGAHAAPIVAALLRAWPHRPEEKGK
ncbi:penicillin-binding transpeptidase domain-containing protein [Pseudoduganella sp. GCM10020061]|uniref:penicillin-binding transpeptidase domain-containing protein n=1 Tax=Pseudoduganella sp. GCM10020061 TaxID=3317345 RepID=UPI00363D75E1